MPGTDWIPGVSQVKSGIKLIAGDVKGAAKTQENFLRECPGVSQVTSTVQLATGDPKGAWETQKRCLKTVDNIANATPVVGHLKGAVHHIVGDSEGGDRALDTANQSTIIIATGAATIVQKAVSDVVGAKRTQENIAKGITKTNPEPNQPIIICGENIQVDSLKVKSIE